MRWLRRDARRLPGSLCDETTAAAVKADRLDRPVEAGRYEPPPVAVALPLPVSGIISRLRAENEALRARLADTAQGSTREAVLREQLREVTADRDLLHAANGRLVARIRGLELTLAAVAGHATVPAAPTVEMPRVRSMPAPARQSAAEPRR